MNTIRKLSVLVVVNLLVFLVFAELLALAYYYARGDGLFYQNGPRLKLVEEAKNNQLIKNGSKLYPLFGFVQLFKGSWKNDNEFKLNDYGFWSEFGEYPVIKQHENQYIIGVFGGSVAMQFHESARNRLASLLQQHQFFEDKEIVVLSFAHVAYKQPQQLMILNYFLALGQPLDMAINIDGFNEVTLGVLNRRRGYGFSMPQASLIEAFKNLLDPMTMTPERLAQLTLISRIKKELNDLVSASDNISLASFSLTMEKLYAHKMGTYNRAVGAYEQSAPSTRESLIYLNRADQQFDQKLLFEKISNHWAESSILMQNVLDSRGILYLHILQPNQYYSERVFGEEEARIALSTRKKHGWRQAEGGYPYLLNKKDLLTSRGVHFFNGVPIFDQEPRAVYKDNCCHYNQLGNEILADFVAKAILEVVEERRE